MNGIKEQKTVQIFAHNLAKLRKDRQMSQADLAEQVGLSRGIIGYYESCSKNPTLKSLVRFADFFGVPVSYLLEDQEQPQTPKTSRLEQQVLRIKQLSPAKQRMVSDIIEATLNSK